MAAWKPGSRGGTNTGTTPRPRHNRLTRPTTSGWVCGPWKIVSLSNWASPGRPNSLQCSTRHSTTNFAVTLAPRGQDATRPPCSETVLSTSTWGPPLMTSPSTASTLSNSRLRQATSGRYQARRGRRPSGPLPAIQHAAPAEDAVDGPLRGKRLDVAAPQGLEDRFGPMETQVALDLQLAAHLPDQVLDAGLGSLGGVWDPRAIGPIDPVEALALGVADPAVDGARTHTEVACDLLLRLAPAYGLDHGPAAGDFPVGLLMVHPSSGGLFLTSLHRVRSGCCGS